MRDINIFIYWFSSRTDYSISAPPALSPSFSLEKYDLFIHEYARMKYQVWRCEEIRPILWTFLPQGTQHTLPGQKTPRTFVMTDSGQPSWVLPDTRDRQYKHVPLDTKGKRRGTITH